MKLALVLLGFFLLLFSSTLSAQEKRSVLQLRTGIVTLEPNLRTTVVDSLNATLPRFHNKAILILRFESIPSGTSKQVLSENGIELLNYLSENSFTASISFPIDISVIQKARGLSI